MISMCTSNLVHRSLVEDPLGPASVPSTYNSTFSELTLITLDFNVRNLQYHLINAFFKNQHVSELAR